MGTELYKPHPVTSTSVVVPTGCNSLITTLIPRYVVCAANRSKSGVIVLGVRHFCPLMRQAIDNATESDERYQEQGFVDQWGNFMDRTLAWEIAKKQGQIRRTVGHAYETDDTLVGELYSEHLY